MLYTRFHGPYDGSLGRKGIERMANGQLTSFISAKAYPLASIS